MPCSKPRPRSRPFIDALESRRLLATVPSGLVDSAFGGAITSGTAMEFAPDGRLFVTTQNGTVRIIQPDGTLLPTLALNLAVDGVGERGLLGLAFDPTFNATQTGADYIYLYHTVPGVSGGAPFNRVSRFSVSGNTIDPSSQTPIVSLDPLSATNHNGGAIHFGNDGKLYIAVGDNAVSSNAQSVANRHGKVLRINKDGTIPSDNPATFQVRPSTSTTYTTVTSTGANRAIWALGLRNPYTFDVDETTGTLFINDVGDGAPTSWEEVNVGGAGRNYGWPRTEGDFSNGTAGNEQFTRPLYAYGRGTTFPLGQAISGGVRYAGSNAPLQFAQQYQGKYFFGDFVGQWIGYIDPAAPPAVSGGAALATSAGNLIDLKMGSDGAIYYLQRSGVASGVRKISVNAALAPSITQQPVNRSTAPGQPVTFNVTATGPGTLTYQWTRNGENIAGATSSSYTITNPQAGDDNAVFRVRVGNTSGVALSSAATLDVVVDTTAPTITSQAFNRDDAQHRVTIVFSEDVTGAAGAGNVVLVNSDTGATVATSAAYSSATRTLVLTPDSRLPTGSYRVTFSNVTDQAGNALVSSPFNFRFREGDANGDGLVNFADLVVLGTNYNQSSRTYSQGDFNYDGTVNFSDLVILGGNYNTGSLEIQATQSSAKARPAARRSATAGVMS